MPRTNKNKEEKDPELESVLDETPPPIEEPIEKEPDESEVVDDKLPDPENEEPTEEAEVVEPPIEEKKDPVQAPVETQEDKDKRYKAQQTEAQIQAEKNKALVQKAEEAKKISDPTVEELKAFVAQDGANWDELTNFEQGMAKRTFISEKKSNLVLEAVEQGKQVDEWAAKVDEFIDSTDGQPDYIELSSHETDFRKFAMKESHRGTPISILLGAFLHDLPKTTPKRTTLFPTGGGGEKVEVKSGITDAETAAKLRTSNPREYARQVKAGKIKIEI